MIKVILCILGIIGFLLACNEQPEAEIQNWWVNVSGLVILLGSVVINHVLYEGKD